MARLKYQKVDKSSVAEHALENKHRMDIENLREIRPLHINLKIVVCGVPFAH